MIVRLLALAALALPVLALTVAPDAAAQTKVGVSSAVNANTTSIPPGQPVRTLLVGKDIAFNEKILTTTGGQAQILFLDESSFSVGENSEVVIDEFVYNPNAGTGRIVASATKGVFRFVGGALSKNEGGVTFRTPSATIGIRGGIAVFTIDPVSQTTRATMLFGLTMTVIGSDGSMQRVTQPGFGTTVSPGGTPSKPTPTPPAQLMAAISQLEGRTTATAGATEVPTDGRVARSDVAITNSERIGVAIVDAAQALQSVSTPILQDPTAAGGPAATDIGNKQGAVDTSPSPPPSPVVSAPPPPPPPPGSFAGQFQRTTAGSSVGFTDTTDDNNRPFIAAPLDTATRTITASLGPTTNFGSATVTVTLPALVVANGGLFFNVPATTAFGAGSATGELTADRNFFRATITDATAQQSFIFGGTTPLTTVTQSGSTLRAFGIANNTLPDSFVPFLAANAGGSFLAGTRVSSSFLTALPSGGSIDDGTGKGLLASIVINGTGAGQTSALVVSTGAYDSTALPSVQQVGVVRGATRQDGTALGSLVAGTYGSTTDLNGVALFGGTPFGLTQHNYSVIGGNVQTLDIANAATGTVAPSYSLTAQGSIFAFNRSAQTITGFAAGLGEANAGAPQLLVGSSQAGATIGTDVSITTDPGTNSVSAAISVNQLGGGAATNRVIQFGGTGRSSAFISDSVFGATDSAVSSTVGGANVASSTFLVSSKTLGATTLAEFLSDNNNAALVGLIPFDTQTGNAVTSFCECDFVKWGFWGGDVANTNVAGGRERFQLNTWVAGPITNAASVPASGTASFRGHAIGTVFNAGSSYVAIGDLRYEVNFGTSKGNLTISQFDGLILQGLMSLGGGAARNQYTGTLAVNGPAGLTASASGAFYGPNAQETGGSFQISGATYRAGGIFAGKRP